MFAHCRHAPAAVLAVGLAGGLLLGAPAGGAPPRLSRGAATAPPASDTAWSEQLFALGWKRESELEDLAGAIAAYEQVVRNSPRNRRLGVRALIRLSECYRKTGRQEQSREVLRRYWRLSRSGDDAVVPDEVRLLPPDAGLVVAIEIARVRTTSVGTDWLRAQDAKRREREAGGAEGREAAARDRGAAGKDSRRAGAGGRREKDVAATRARQVVRSAVSDAGMALRQDLDRLFIGVRPSGRSVTVWSGADLRRRLEPRLLERRTGDLDSSGGHALIPLDTLPARPVAAFASDRELLTGADEDVRAALTARRASAGRDGYMRPDVRRLFADVPADAVFWVVGRGDTIAAAARVDIPGLIAFPLPSVDGLVVVGNMDYDLALFFALYTGDAVRARALGAVATRLIEAWRARKTEVASNDEQDHWHSEKLERALLDSLDVDPTLDGGALRASAHLPYRDLLASGVVAP